MQRQSPVHYISPSAISLIPNCNGSADDIAVRVASGTKIKVYSPRAGIDYVNGEAQQWTLTGRNRRLAESNKPYTIYARLPQKDKTKGYLLFAPKDGNADDGWTDKYRYITPDGFSDMTGAFVRDGNLYVRLGDVTLPENGKRSITFDTGILGTGKFNTDWALSPDALPLRIELGCTISDEDAGPSPYVYWGQSLVLSAILTEAWTGTDIQRFDHWEITRDSGVAAADDVWNHPQGEGSYHALTNGSITLQHGRGAGNTDDFNGAVSVTFTVTAMQNTGTEENPVYEPLESASICILAETWEKYELSLSASMVTYNPQTGAYTPGSGGITFNIRATDQKSDTFLLTKNQYTDAGLVAEYARIDSSAWHALAVSGSGTDVALGLIPIRIFYQQESINVRLRNAAGMELHRVTVSFLRDGEDSKEREWIYRLDTNTGYDSTTGTAPDTDPESPTYGQRIPVSGQTGGVDNCLLVDDFVPTNWTDESTGVSSDHDTEYTSYREYDRDNNRWGAFTAPKTWSHYGKDGDNAPYDLLSYGRASSRILSGGTPSGFDSTTGWQNVAPATSDTYPYIWQRTQHYDSAGQLTSTSYVCLTGEDGEQGGPGGPGPAGADALNVVVSPASMILQQDINNKDGIAYAADNNLGRFSIQVLKGSNACNITSITATASQVYVYNSPSTGQQDPSAPCTWTPSVPQIAEMFLKGIATDNQNNYYTTGQIVLSIIYTDPDTNTSKTITSIITKVYVNLLGSWSERVVADTKTAIAQSTWFDLDAQGNIVESERLGTFERSSKENLSRLDEQTYVTVKSDTSSLFSITTAGDYRIVLDLSKTPGVTYPDDEVTVTLEKDNNGTWEPVQGGTYQHQKYYDRLEDVLTLNVGSYRISVSPSATIENLAVFSTSTKYSELSQTVNQIGLTVYDENTGVGALNVKADAITSTVKAGSGNRNLFGFTACSFGVATNDCGYPAIQSYGMLLRFAGDTDITGRLARIAIPSLETGKTYTLSCQIKMTSAAAHIEIDLGDTSGGLKTIEATTSWQNIEVQLLFNNTSHPEYKWIDFGMFPADYVAGNYALLRHVKLEEGELATAFCIANEDINSVTNVRPVDAWTISENMAEDGTITCPSGKKVYKTLAMPSAPSGQADEYIDYISANGLTSIETGKVYTISYWLKSSANNTHRVTTYMYPDLTPVSQDFVALVGDDSQSERIAPDCVTDVGVTTDWKKHYIHIYVMALPSGGSVNCLPLRLTRNNGSAWNTQGTLYISDIQLCEGYVTDENTAVNESYSEIKQTAKEIDLSVRTDLAETGINISGESKSIHMTAQNTIIDSDVAVGSLSTLGDGCRVNISGGIAEFFGLNGIVNIRLGLDDDGCAVLKFYNKDGTFMYDLGPHGITQELNSKASVFSNTAVIEHAVSSGEELMLMSNSHAHALALAKLQGAAVRYRFSEGYSALGSGDIRTYLVSGTSSPSSYNDKAYETDARSSAQDNWHPTGQQIAQGYYVGVAHNISGTLYYRQVYHVFAQGSLPTLLGDIYYNYNSVQDRAYICNQNGDNYTEPSRYMMIEYLNGEDPSQRPSPSPYV